MGSPQPVQVGIDVADDLLGPMSVYGFFTKLGHAIVNRWIPASFVFLFTMMIAYILPKGLATIIYRFTGREHYAKLIAAFLRMFLVLFSLYCTFEVLTMDLLTFALTFGISGIGVNLVLVAPLGDICYGVLIRLFDTIKVGQAIKIDGCEGIVHKLDTFNVIIVNKQLKEVYTIPNRTVGGSVITRLLGPKVETYKLDAQTFEEMKPALVKDRAAFNVYQYLSVDDPFAG